MPNPPATVKRQRELLAVLEPLRAALLRIPGCNSNGIGLTVAAFERLRIDGGGPESVRPEDITISVSFESGEAFTSGADRVDELLGNSPHECRVGGHNVLL
ncbi:MAG: hypothetical protein WCB51_11250 [Candidatus Dormiibacterota bacterium]